MEPGRRIIVCDYRQTACHRFEGYIPKSLGFARKQEHVRRCIVRGQLLAGLHATENQIAMFVLQRPTKRTVTYEHEFNRLTFLLYEPVGFYGHGEILLRCKPTYIQNGQVRIRHPPVAPEFGAAAMRTEELAINASAHERDIFEA